MHAQAGEKRGEVQVTSYFPDIRSTMGCRSIRFAASTMLLSFPPYSFLYDLTIFHTALIRLLVIILAPQPPPHNPIALVN